jgi:hypothetical protein
MQGMVLNHSARLLRISLKQALAVLVLSVASLGCSFFPPEYKVPLSFSVRIANGHGPVVGLKLRVTRFKTEEFSRLSLEQQRLAKPGQFVELIAESLTDGHGEAHFNIRKSGHFDLQPDHPATHLDWVSLDVVPDAAPNTVKLKWPTSAILQTKQLHGRITDGLMSSSSAPLKKVNLSLHALVSFTEVGTTTTKDDGSFQFDDVPPGLYFLRMLPKEDAANGDSNQQQGDIAIYVGKDSPWESLSIATNYGSCGLFYDLEENKGRYKPKACFKGGEPVTCNY